MSNFILRIFFIFILSFIANAEEKNNVMNQNRKDKLPSIMVKEDMFTHNVNGKSQGGLLMDLLVNSWKIIYDKYSRQCKYQSPELSYAELQNILNFNDEDVTYNSEAKANEPQASIKTEWLTCNITFKDKIYDGKDNAVKLTAVVIDNEVQKKSDEHGEYDKNKGWIARIIEFFSGGDIH